jgi:hypothetical protein
LSPATFSSSPAAGPSTKLQKHAEHVMHAMWKSLPETDAYLPIGQQSIARAARRTFLHFQPERYRSFSIAWLHCAQRFGLAMPYGEFPPMSNSEIRHRVIHHSTAAFDDNTAKFTNTRGVVVTAEARELGTLCAHVRGGTCAHNLYSRRRHPARGIRSRCCVAQAALVVLPRPSDNAHTPMKHTQARGIPRTRSRAFRSERCDVSPARSASGLAKMAYLRIRTLRTEDPFWRRAALHFSKLGILFVPASARTPRRRHGLQSLPDTAPAQCGGGRTRCYSLGT